MTAGCVEYLLLTFLYLLFILVQYSVSHFTDMGHCLTGFLFTDIT